MSNSFPDRTFEFWEWTASMGSLLIRSPKSESEPLNVDLTFHGVSFLALPNRMIGLAIELALPHELEAIPDSIRREMSETDKVFALVSAGQRHLLVGPGFRVEEHSRDVSDSPFISFIPAVPPPPSGRRVAPSFPTRQFRLGRMEERHGAFSIGSEPRTGRDGPEKGVPYVQVVFENFAYVSAPFVLKGLEVVEPTGGEVERVRWILGDQWVSDLKVYVLSSEGQRHIMVGTDMWAEESAENLFREDLAAKISSQGE